ncbi:hypothetical protein MRB53_039962 [Persea americana]|nr:hypothetical protein MRB53_039962 [Persea americana]
MYPPCAFSVYVCPPPRIAFADEHDISKRKITPSPNDPLSPQPRPSPSHPPAKANLSRPLSPTPPPPSPHPPQPAIHPSLPPHQLPMRPLLHHPPVLQHINPIRAHHGAQPMRDRDEGATRRCAAVRACDTAVCAWASSAEVASSRRMMGVARRRARARISAEEVCVGERFGGVEAEGEIRPDRAREELRSWLTRARARR